MATNLGARPKEVQLAEGGITDWNQEKENSEQEELLVTGASTPANKKSWAAVLGGGLPKREDRNVLEVVLEKETKGSFNA